MIENINNLENNSQIISDICIIGAGAAGITLALELDKSNKSITLLEAGGEDFPSKEEGYDIYSGQSVGREYDVQNSRLRYFGGSTNHWGGWCRPLDEADFIGKNNNGWPIKKSELLPYYSQAAKICEIDNYQLIEKNNVLDEKDTLTFSESKLLTNKFFLFSPPTRFGTRYKQNILKSQNIKCYLFANATDLIINNGVVNGVKITSLRQKTFTVKSKTVIVAMGGLENTRFLLLNTSKYKADGIPNNNQLIGKYFMDHPGINPGMFMLQKDLKYYRHLGERGVVLPFVGLKNNQIIDKDLMNLAIFLNPIKESESLKSNYFDNSFFQPSQQGGNYSYNAIFEPTAYKNSQITLSEEVDELNQRKLVLDWQIDPNDFIRAENTFNVIAKEISLLGLGRAKFDSEYLKKTKKSAGYGMHHMGTTRMGKGSATSVTDSYGELHEIKNLFVAGSSLFPSVGFSNPTLTITALSIRLAQKLTK